MARPLRIEFPGAFYHVINRGNAGEDIYYNKRDREKFLEYLEKAVERFSIKIHVYCLMTNHYHLLVETPLPNLSKTVKWINVSYAVYFNRKHKRNGHLFQGRFKSILVEEDEYLQQLSRYIHLNPVRSGMVEDLSSYPWSSYLVFIGENKKPEWLETDWLLSLFGKRPKTAVANYRNFVEQIDATKIENPAKNLVGGFILGSPDFVNWVKNTFLANQHEIKDIPQIKDLKDRPSPGSVVAAVCKEYRCTAELILQKGRKNNIARDVAIYLSRDLTGQQGIDLGKYFGNISGAGITVRYNVLERQMKTNSKLKRQLYRIRNTIINN